MGEVLRWEALRPDLHTKASLEVRLVHWYVGVVATLIGGTENVLSGRLGKTTLQRTLT